jgi:aspartyl-tRNA(Asn)/glutamyl-tRNA(Gln) amidotransferase subunit A
MEITDPTRLTACEATAALRAGRISSVALTEAYLERIQAVDPAVRAYVTVTADVALALADAADRRRAAGQDGPLLGVPYALKDVFTTAGITTTAGSRILADYVPPDSSTVYRRLDDAGAVLLGKLNMDEFAMGSSTESSAFFATRNPWNLDRVPGGSSGGSAAAVAADVAAFTVGSDTGGSVRQPAALCGAVGLKPTYGRVSRYGLVAFASSLDQAGPVTKDVRDAAVVLGVLAGPDPADSTSLDVPVPDYTAALGAGNLAGLRFGVPHAHFGAGLDDGVRAAVEAAIDVLSGLGAERVDVDLPHAHYAVAAYYVLAPAEASANLARYDGLRYGYSAPEDDLWERYRQTRHDGFGPEVTRRVILGTFALSSGYHEAYYRRAAAARARIRADLDAALAVCDVLVGPTTPTPACRLGEKVGDPLAMYLSDVYTVGLNLAGYPGLSVPCGFVDGLPVGLQVMGRALDEATVLRVAHAYERATQWRRYRPALTEVLA